MRWVDAEKYDTYNALTALEIYYCETDHFESFNDVITSNVETWTTHEVILNWV